MRSVITFAIAMVLGACGRPDAEDGHVPTGPLARVLVDSAGGVRLNGRSVTLEELADTLRAAGARDGGVIYSREAPDADPLPAQDATVERVMKLIMDLRLPVRLVRPESLATAG